MVPFASTQLIHRLLWVTSAGAPTPLPATFRMISLNMKIEPLRGDNDCSSDSMQETLSSSKSRSRTTHFIPTKDAIRVLIRLQYSNGSRTNKPASATDCVSGFPSLGQRFYGGLLPGTFLTRRSHLSSMEQKRRTNKRAFSSASSSSPSLLLLLLCDGPASILLHERSL